MIQSGVKEKTLLGLRVAAIAAAAAWVFWPALSGAWLWDDGLEVAQNGALRTAAGLAAIWRGSVGQDYLPVKSTVQWIQWQLWSDHVVGYHLTNLGLHVLSALLLWRVLAQLGAGRSWAWFGGLLFAVHPLAVESVAWISELKNTLSLALLLLAMGCYLEFDASPSLLAGRELRRGKFLSGASRGEKFGGLSYLCSIGCFLAAMLAKSSVVMFPVCLLLHAWWRRGRITWADVRATAPFFAVSLTLGVVTIQFQQQRAIGGNPFELEGLWARTAAAGLAAVSYLYHCVFPFGLMPIYPRWDVSSPSLLQFLPWPLLAAAACWLAKRRREWSRAACFGLGCFFVNLVPALGFVPMAYLRFAWMADHLAYLSLACFCGLAAAGLSVVGRLGEAAARPSVFASLRRDKSAWPTIKLLALTLVAILAAESRRLAPIYRSPETLWTYELKENPGAWTAHYDLGTLLIGEGRLPEATEQLEQAVRINPNYFPAQMNLGNLLVMGGDPLTAIVHYRRALQSNPNSAETHFNLGNALWRLRRRDEAIAEYREAVRLRPDYVDAANSLQRSLRLQGR